MKKAIRKAWRRRYDYYCYHCQKHRYTVKFERKTIGLCRVCGGQIVDERQKTLFN